jgi:hypothetical protein
MPLAPKDVADNKGDQQAMGIVFISPPIVSEFAEHGGISQHDGGRYGKDSPDLFERDA